MFLSLILFFPSFSFSSLVVARTHCKEYLKNDLYDLSGLHSGKNWETGPLKCDSFSCGWIMCYFFKAMFEIPLKIALWVEARKEG